MREAHAEGRAAFYAAADTLGGRDLQVWVAGILDAAREWRQLRQMAAAASAMPTPEPQPTNAIVDL